MQNQDNYSEMLARMRLNSQKPAQKYYYRWLYSKVDQKLPNHGKILEIGAGYGMSEEFIDSKRVYRTEIMKNVPPGVHGGIDASKLPFENEVFSSTFAVDAIHHVPDSLRAIKEMLRVTEIGGYVILLEPYVSLLSYPIYKLFHGEKTSFKLDITRPKTWVTEAPEDGNQGVMQNLLKIITKQDQGIAFKSIQVTYLSPLSFFATGGLSRPIPIAKSVIRAIVKLEKYIPSNILKVTGSRILVIFEK